MLSFLLWLTFGLASQLPFIYVEENNAPFIFNSLFGLLKQWPNTLHPTGHSIVPVTIAPDTLLYHARTDTQSPPSPDWFGFSPELGFSLVQMAPSGQPTYLLTYQSTRPLRTLLFDGLSAFPTELDVGWMDNLETFINGAGQRGTGRERPTRGGLKEEYERAVGLCEWASARDIDGFIRMNSGFELIWCDFASSAIEFVSQLNVTPPHYPLNKPNIAVPDHPIRLRGAPDAPRTLAFPFFSLSAFHEWARMYTSYNMAPLPFLTIHPAGMVTYYHPRLTSLAQTRAGQRMAQHRIWPTISNEDALAVRSEVEDVASRDFNAGSGMDWSSLARIMVENWTHRIRHLRSVLSNATSSSSDSMNFKKVVEEVQLLTYSPLMPYMDTTFAVNASGYDLFFADSPHPRQSGLDRCATRYTRRLHRTGLMTSQERLLKWSVDKIQRRICTDFGIIFAESTAESLSSLDPIGLSRKLRQWADRMERLSSYLEWPTELSCEEVCAPDSICALPIWPFEPLWPEHHLDLVPACQKIDVFGGPETWRKQWANSTD